MSDKGRIVGAAGGAVGLGSFSVLIATCCGVPWAATLFGAAGAVALARLSFVLPYTFAGAIALLAFAFWMAYRPLPECADGTCESANRTRMRWVVWAAALFVVTIVLLAVLSIVTA